MINKTAITILLLFMLLDIITGVIKAVIQGDVKSSKMRDGLLKKALEIIVGVVGYGVDVLMNTNTIGNVVVMALAGSEGISILENAGTYVPLPSKLKNILEALKDNGNENKNDTK